MSLQVLVVIGVGGMGAAIARRLGTGKQVLLADYDATLLSSTYKSLRAEGYCVHQEEVDISSHEAVKKLAHVAASLGLVSQIALAAGISPARGDDDRIFAVNLAGTAFVIEEFEGIVAEGGSCIVISSMAGHQAALELPAEHVNAIASTPADQILDLPVLKSLVSSPGAAYSVSKCINLVQVQRASLAWAARGARINSISPGPIETPLLAAEREGEHGARVALMLQTTPLKRIGNTGDIANVAAFLLGAESSFVTGSDILIDGGQLALARQHMQKSS